jgi:hypothetical protein
MPPANVARRQIEHRRSVPTPPLRARMRATIGVGSHAGSARLPRRSSHVDVARWCARTCIRQHQGGHAAENFWVPKVLRRHGKVEGPDSSVQSRVPPFHDDTCSRRQASVRAIGSKAISRPNGVSWEARRCGTSPYSSPWHCAARQTRWHCASIPCSPSAAAGYSAAANRPDPSRY